MGVAGSKKLPKEDMQFLMDNTNFTKQQIKAWYKGFMVSRIHLLLFFLQTNDKLTSGQSNLAKRPHRRRTWMVQYSPGGTNVHTRFLGLTPVHNPGGISIGSAVFAGLTIVADRQTDRPRYTPSVTIGCI